jgi:hypothetical protein
MKHLIGGTFGRLSVSAKSQRKCLPSLLAVLLICEAILEPNLLTAEQVPVRHMEGVLHGFLVLRTLQGETIANGDLQQVVKGQRVTSRLIFRFKDSSLYEETTVFSQRRSFRLLSDRVVQRGPSFKDPSDTSIDASTGEVTVRSMEDGKEKVVCNRLHLPSDLANGLVFTLLKNIQSDATSTTVSMVAGASKPRLVKLNIVPEGEETLSVGLLDYQVLRYVVKVEIGGVTGVVAPLIGKKPPDIHIWVLKAPAPVVVKSEGPLYEDGPIWRIELGTPEP